jgi:hypothetical protein
MGSMSIVYKTLMESLQARDDCKLVCSSGEGRVLLKWILREIFV